MAHGKVISTAEVADRECALSLNTNHSQQQGQPKIPLNS